MTATPNTALQRTATLSGEMPGAALGSTGSVTASANAHAAPSPSAAAGKAAAAGSRSLSFWSLGVTTHPHMKYAFCLFLTLLACLAQALAAPGSDLKVEIVPPYPNLAFLLPQIRVRFTNTGKNAVRIMRPLPWSFLGNPPLYNATLHDESGALAPAQLFCGNALDNPKLPEGTKWPEDFVVTLARDESFETVVLVPFRPSAQAFSILSFDYVMPENPPSRLKLTYPENLWHGTARAADVTLSPQPPKK